MCREMPWADIRRAVLVSGSGGQLCASDSTEVVNSLEERSLVSHGSEKIYCTLQQETRERTDSHFAAAQKL